MNVKRFVAPDMRAAIRRVREEQGPDAIIVSSRECEDGVEILAVLDTDGNWAVDEPPKAPLRVTAELRGDQARRLERHRMVDAAQPQRSAATLTERLSARAAQAAPASAAASEPDRAAATAEAPLRGVPDCFYAEEADLAEVPRPGWMAPDSAAEPALERSASHFTDRLPGAATGFSPEVAPGQAPDPLAEREAQPRDAAAFQYDAADGEAELDEPAVAPEADASLEGLRRELQSMRGLLQEELAHLSGEVYTQREPIRAQIARRLERLGLDARLARSIADDLDATDSLRAASREALALLARRLPVAERNVLVRGGCIALVGPNGVGKTATAMKLAAAFAREHGRHRVALIAADCDRSRAERELLAIGQQLGIYTLVASGRDELRSALDTVSDRPLVLVDTTGMGYRDPRLQDTARLLADLPGVEPWLVLAASAQRSALEATIRRYALLAPRACVLTRLDECAVLGEALCATAACGLPVSFVTTGPGCEGNLLGARGEWFVRRMVAMSREDGAADASGADPARGAISRETAHA